MMISTPTVSRIQKDILSRLLAAEDIVVEHRNEATTAAFDVKNRILILPVWQDMSNQLYDMLVGHEVGHALYTPVDSFDAIDEIALPGDQAYVKGLLNIVEDARIERKMKAKFPGLRRDFSAAYSDLHEQRDFFGLTDGDGVVRVDDLDLPNRLNLHFKIGLFDLVTIPFTDEERVWVDRISTTETWADVVDVVADLYASLDRDQEQQEQPEDMPMPTSEEGDASGSDSGDQSESSNSNDGGQDGQDSGQSMEDDTDDGESADSNDTGDTGQSGSGQVGDTMGQPTGIETVDAFDDALQGLNKTDSTYWDRNHYGDLGKYDYRDWVVDADRVWEGLQCDTASEVKQELDRRVARGASVLAKQFDMKKAADAHRRTTVAKTGVIDTMKMVNYKFTDDIFRRNNVVADGKNHGLVCFIDWSGSMAQDMGATIEQLYLLATFCKKASIPFEFYAFSSWNGGYDSFYRGYDDNDNPAPWHNDARAWTETQGGPGDMTLLNLVNGNMRAADFKKAMTNIACLWKHYTQYYGKNNDSYVSMDIPRHLHLGGTPLDDAIVLAMDLVPAFRDKNGLQIVHTVFLTDGESHNAENLRDFTHIRRGRRTYDLKGDRARNRTANLIEMFRKETGSKAIGMFLTRATRSTSYLFPSSWGWEQQEEMMKQFKKENFVNCGEYKGYTEYFILKADTRVKAAADINELDADVSFAKLRNTFAKSNTQAITSRTVLNRLAELISE